MFDILIRFQEKRVALIGDIENKCYDFVIFITANWGEGNVLYREQNIMHS